MGYLPELRKLAHLKNQVTELKELISNGETHKVGDAIFMMKYERVEGPSYEYSYQIFKGRISETDVDRYDDRWKYKIELDNGKWGLSDGDNICSRDESPESLADYLKNLKKD